MMSFPMFKRNMGNIFRLGWIFLALLSMYVIVIVYMFDPKLAQMLNDYQEALPGMMAAVGMVGSTGTLMEFVNTYLYGFIMTLIPVIFTIILTNQLVMKYVDSGSLACILATPNSRGKIILTQAVSLILGIVLLMGLTIGVCYGACEYFFPGKLPLETYVNLNMGVLCLQLAMAGITFFAACVCNDAKGYFLVGGGLPLLFYVIQMLANMGGDLENLKYGTLFTLFRGEQIVNGSTGLSDDLILLGIGAVLFLMGGLYFTKKDLPL